MDRYRILQKRPSDGRNWWPDDGFWREPEVSAPRLYGPREGIGTAYGPPLLKGSPGLRHP